MGFSELIGALFLILGRPGTDADGDGFGRREDCNDSDARVHPGATEICNSLNDDCDPSTSESGMVSVEGTAYGTIQDAVDAAPEGATVRICDGAWYENVEIRRGMTLEGLGPHRSIIDGSELNPVVTIVGGSHVTLRGLTLQHGVGQAHGTLGPGGGILVSSVGVLRVDDCVVRHNAATRGGGLAGPHAGDVVLTRSTFHGNTATDSGGGADFYAGVRGNDVDIRECVFTDNEAGWGGALAFGYDADYGPAEASITDTLIDGNRTANRRFAYGGGIYSFVDTLTLNGVTISDNRGGTGAGVYAVWEVIADDETLITGNRTWTSGSGGGGLAMNGTWTGGTFEGNSAAFGGGVLLRFDSELHGAVLQGNHATNSGGGVYMIYGGSEINDSVITENVSDNVGGGIGTDRVPATAFVRSSTVTANVAAVAGGGAYVRMSLDSEASDWGEDETDNEPDDVAFRSHGTEVSYDNFGAAEDFVCYPTAGTCE